MDGEDIFKSIIKYGKRNQKGKRKTYILIQLPDRIKIPSKHKFQFNLNFEDDEKGLISMDYAGFVKEGFGEYQNNFLGFLKFENSENVYCVFFVDDLIGMIAPEYIEHVTLNVIDCLPSILIKIDLSGGWCEVDNEIIV